MYYTQTEVRSQLNKRPKRVNFVAIQNSHAIACAGYHQFTVRTGYDSVIADRTSDLFAYTAKKEGIVKSINDKGVIIDYTDGTVQGYEIGRRYGNSAGLIIPHNVVTLLKEGDKVNVGDTICYNDGFFEPDLFNPKRVVFKNSINVKTVLWESSQTLEDASSISSRLADKLSTKITKVKDIVLTFDQSITGLLKVGEAVDAETILCVIEDSITANNNLFSDASVDTLRVVSAQTPKAGVRGVIERIEVFYHGDREDMSDSLRLISLASDRQLKAKAESIGAEVFTGQVDSGFRINNDPLSLDSLAIRIYITSSVGTGNGDKGVFANQMKTVFSEIISDDMTTESGELIDGVFGAQSISDRIVTNPYIIGTTNTLLKVIAKKAIAAYRE